MRACRQRRGQSRAGSALAGIQGGTMERSEAKASWGLESNPERDAQPPEDSEGRLHILVVSNQITQEMGCGKQWKGKQLMNTPHPRDCADHTPPEENQYCVTEHLDRIYFFLSLWSELT